MDKQPLTGKTVVITRSAEGSEDWINEFTELGALVYNLPTIAMEPLKVNSDLEHEFKNLPEVDWLIFTSATGVRYFAKMTRELDLNPAGREMPPVAAVGNKTADAARALGMRVEYIPDSETSDELGRDLEPVAHKTIMLLRTTIASDELPSKLAKRDAIIKDLKIYKTSPRTDPDEQFSEMLAKGAVAYVTFASPSAVEGFCARITIDDMVIAKKIPVVAIGPSTAEALKKHHFEQLLVAERASVAGVIMAILEHIK